jgi:hypothetical protein
MAKEITRTPAFDLEGYWAFTVKYADGTKKTVLEHREVMEQHLGRKLRKGEVVHHKDGNRKNNDVDNLELMEDGEHATFHLSQKGIEYVTLTCKRCGKVFERKARDERHNRKQGKEGPYCGRRCAGKVHH